MSLQHFNMNNPAPWNKDRKVGPRLHLKAPEVLAIRHALRKAGRQRDLAIFLTGIDSMLRCSDLLGLRVADVQSPKGEIYNRLEVGQEKTNEMVYPTFTDQTQKALAAWISSSGKRRTDWLFTALKSPHGPGLGASQYRDLVKEWVSTIGLDPSKYSTHSLRRTKPVWMWQYGNPNRVTITVLKELLGHKSVESTTRYLGLDAMEAQDVALEHDIFAAGAGRKHRSIRTLSIGDVKAIAAATAALLDQGKPAVASQQEILSGRTLNDADLAAIAAAFHKTPEGQGG